MRAIAVICLLLAAALMVCALPASACAQAADSGSFGPSVIAGAGVGYAVDGPDSRETFLTQFVGLRVATLHAGGVYLCYQHGSISDKNVGGNGGKLILADRWRQLPDFTWLIGLGFLDNIRAIENQTDLKVGLTGELGLTYDASEWIEIGLFGTAWDRGPEPETADPYSKEAQRIGAGRVSWAVHFFGTVKDPFKLIGLIPGLGD